MSLTIEENEELTDILAAIEAERGALNDWERGFFDDQLKRHTQYGAGIRLSPKQWAMIRKIYTNITGEPPPGDPGPGEPDRDGDEDEIPF